MLSLCRPWRWWGSSLCPFIVIRFKSYQTKNHSYCFMWWISYMAGRYDITRYDPPITHFRNSCNVSFFSARALFCKKNIFQFQCFGSSFLLLLKLRIFSSRTCLWSDIRLLTWPKLPGPGTRCHTLQMRFDWALAGSIFLFSIRASQR